MESFWIEFGVYILVFLCFALVLLLRVLISSRSHDELFRGLRAGSLMPAAAAANNGWVDWVQACFLKRPNVPPRWSRDDAGRELDGFLSNQLSYQALMRLSFVAPLIGVFITMFKFASYQAADTPDVNLGLIFQTASGPLFVGLGTGASAAIICQGLILLAQRRLYATRQTGMKWFDEEVWAKVKESPAAPGVHELDQTFRDAAKAHDTATQTINTAANKLESAANMFSTSSTNLKEKLSTLTGNVNRELRALVSALEPLKTVAGGLHQVQDQLTPAAQKFADSTTAFHSSQQSFADILSTTQKALAKAVKQQEEAVTGLTTTLHAFDGASKTLVTSAGTQQTAADKLSTAAMNFASAEDRLTVVAQRLHCATDGVQDLKPSVVEPIKQVVSQINDALTDLRGTTGELSRLLKMQPQLLDLLQALSQAAAVAREVHQLPAQLRHSLTETRQQLEDLSSTILKDQTETLSQTLHGVLVQMGLGDGA